MIAWRLNVLRNPRIENTVDLVRVSRPEIRAARFLRRLSAQVLNAPRDCGADAYAAIAMTPRPRAMAGATNGRPSIWRGAGK